MCELKSLLHYYVEKLKTKDKQIEKLKDDLNKIKSSIKQDSKYQSKYANDFNYITAFANSNSNLKGLNKRNTNYKASINDYGQSESKFIKDNPVNIYSDRISNNNSSALEKALKENYKSVSNNSSISNLIGDNSSITNNKSVSKRKKANYSTHNGFRKSNTKTFLINNPKNISNTNSSELPNPINLSNFFKGFTLSSNSLNKIKDRSSILVKKQSGPSRIDLICNKIF